MKSLEVAGGFYRELLPRLGFTVRVKSLGGLEPEGPAHESSTYYAFYFNDPSGNPLEICHRSKRFEV